MKCAVTATWAPAHLHMLGRVEEVIHEELVRELRVAGVHEHLSSAEFPKTVNTRQFETEQKRPGWRPLTMFPLSPSLRSLLCMPTYYSPPAMHCQTLFRHPSLLRCRRHDNKVTPCRWMSTGSYFPLNSLWDAKLGVSAAKVTHYPRNVRPLTRAPPPPFSRTRRGFDSLLFQAIACQMPGCRPRVRKKAPSRSTGKQHRARLIFFAGCDDHAAQAGTDYDTVRVMLCPSHHVQHDEAASIRG